MNHAYYAILAFSTLAITLGFIALLVQKTYIDQRSNQPVSIRIPLIGKLKTNYPALIFVVGGLCLAWFAHEKVTVEKNHWTITGMLKIDPETVTTQAQDILQTHGWTIGNITSFPPVMNISEIEENGRFTFELELPKGQKIEEIIEILQFDKHPFFIGYLNIGSADAEEKTQTTRVYEFKVKPVLSTDPLLSAN